MQLFKEYLTWYVLLLRTVDHLDRPLRAACPWAVPGLGTVGREMPVQELHDSIGALFIAENDATANPS